eukprot:jgi/Ulvmu1/5849/UM025_0108.1
MFIFKLARNGTKISFCRNHDVARQTVLPLISSLARQQRRTASTMWRVECADPAAKSAAELGNATRSCTTGPRSHGVCGQNGPMSVQRWSPAGDAVNRFFLCGHKFLEAKLVADAQGQLTCAVCQTCANPQSHIRLAELRSHC